MFTVRVHCGCGCDSKFVIGVSNKNQPEMKPSWSTPALFDIGGLADVMEYIDVWHARGGKVQNIVLEKVG